jgi:DNA-binding MarR family transcriptional regulator
MLPSKIDPMPPLSGLTAAAQHAFLEVLRAAEFLREDAEGFLKPHGLTGTQYNVLRILRGSQNSGVTCGQIIEQMINRDPDMTRLLDRLEKRGLVSRRRSEADRRVVCTYLTADGLKIVEELDGPVAELHVRQMGFLGEERLRQLEELLGAIRAHHGHGAKATCEGHLKTKQEKDNE